MRQPLFLHFFWKACSDASLDETIGNNGFYQKIKTSAPIGKRRFVVKYQYEIRKYFTSKLYVVFASISTKTSTRNRANYSRGRLRETPRSICGGTGSERSVFDLFQSKGKSSEPATDVEDYVVRLPWKKLFGDKGTFFKKIIMATTGCTILFVGSLPGACLITEYIVSI